MQPILHPDRALRVDVLAPEGHGEIIGGSQRIHDYDLLLRRIEAPAPGRGVPVVSDIRRWTGHPHAGFDGR